MDRILHKEERLKANSDIYSLQYYRFKKTFPTPMTGERNLERENISLLLRTERRLREISQKEISLVRETEQASPERRAEIKEEEEKLKAEYLLEDLRRKRISAEFCKGELKRGFSLWRSNPNWYLHKTLIDDCAERGGCCDRKCGCCRNRKLELPLIRQSAVGHCTTDCPCCQETRGFVITDKTKKSIKNLFALNPVSNYQYFKKIMLASIYGIAMDSEENPLVLIDMPPQYEKEDSAKKEAISWSELI